MSKFGHHPGHALPELFILKDASGFVTSSHANHAHLARTAGLENLLAPITVWHWALNKSADGRVTHHVLKDTFTWDGRV